MNRRNFLKVAGAVAGAFIVPELIAPERRFWALDGTMVGAKPDFITISDMDRRFLDALQVSWPQRFIDGDVVAAMDANGRTSSIYWVYEGSATRWMEYKGYADLSKPVRIGIAMPEYDENVVTRPR